MFRLKVLPTDTASRMGTILLAGTVLRAGTALRAGTGLLVCSLALSATGLADLRIADAAGDLLDPATTYIAPKTADEVPQHSAVGVPAWKLDLVLQGTELELLPTDSRAQLVLRIDDVRPHGASLRYDIEYYGLEPGEYDLLHYLRRKDGSDMLALEPLPVVIESTLPAGVMIPNPVAAGSTPRLGGYRKLLWLAGVLWVLGLWAILRMGRKSRGDGSVQAKRPQSLAERLRPLIEQGLEGRLSPQDSAQLELTLMAFWRGKLNLRERSSAEAAKLLRAHAEAGPLLRQLELWLHSPTGGAVVDVQALLAPYRTLAPDAFVLPGETQAEAPQAARERR